MTAAASAQIGLPETFEQAEDWIAMAFEAHADKNAPQIEFTAIDDLVVMLRAVGRNELAQKVVQEFDLDW